ncbi:sigma E regulatory protein, MucB/RseB [Ectothiorhodospira sp. PHS-1]|uniref:MucB/RseB C-terminal domain-containing protein n=1 Tax=Ectothiorhodospira sp. PHS-1 TaxID=519989 RepID=UPI00024A8306|nr:MucB/RseB C-terminal domain-containing protein [Ectothiorhodospira sp. PHS-1]EHQ52684.1 sigma E regulatory protein, MucB/RseB [Ectothiorhodospira sp. PHS-1]
MQGEGMTARPMEIPPARAHFMEPDLHWRVREMPPGFRVTGVSRRLMAASPHPVQHMILSDGLATVSVFVTRMDRPEDRMRGLTRSGGLHAVVLPWGDYQVTVLGEVPEAAVRLIAESVFHEGEGSR